MKQVFGIVRYNFFGFFRNPKVIFTFLLEFVLSFLLTGRIMIVMETYDTPVQAIEPFLWIFGDGTAVLLSSLLLLLLFSDLPKMTPVTPIPADPHHQEKMAVWAVCLRHTGGHFVHSAYASFYFCAVHAEQLSRQPVERDGSHA